VEGSCEHGNEPSGSIKCWEVSEWLHNWRLLKKGSFPWVSEAQRRLEVNHKLSNTHYLTSWGRGGMGLGAWMCGWGTGVYSAEGEKGKRSTTIAGVVIWWVHVKVKYHAQCLFSSVADREFPERGHTTQHDTSKEGWIKYVTIRNKVMLGLSGFLCPLPRIKGEGVVNRMEICTILRNRPAQYLQVNLCCVAFTHWCRFSIVVDTQLLQTEKHYILLLLVHIIEASNNITIVITFVFRRLF
jgi:hypothetical protein